MLKRPITYTNPFTDETVTEDHYFHISKADLIEMEMEEHAQTYVKDGETFTGMRAKMQRISDTEDGRAVLAEFKDILRRAYGKKDGDRFRKSPEIWDEFSSSEAFSQLLFELFTDAGAMAEFTNGIIPNNIEQIAEEVRKRAAESELEISSVSTGSTDEQTEFTPRVLTRVEAVEMDSTELQAGLADGRYKLS